MMKDRQVEASSASIRIPIVSAVLHCVSMTVLVFLRSSFGYLYLRPKSVFIAFSWAMVLFFIYGWNEPEVWAGYWLVCLFGLGAVILYFVHLLTALFREIYRTGRHDHSSGTSHLLRLLAPKSRTPKIVTTWQIWVEPGFVLFCGLVLRWAFGERHLSSWLIFVAPCLSFKEALNFWFQLRQKKRHLDSQDDAVDIFDDPQVASEAEAPKPAGKEKVRRPRSSQRSVEEDLKERRYAQILRILPPYNLEQAEQNYRQLIKAVHPDPNESTDANVQLSAELNEAIEHFRNTLAK